AKQQEERDKQRAKPRATSAPVFRGVTGMTARARAQARRERHPGAPASRAVEQTQVSNIATGRGGQGTVRGKKGGTHGPRPVPQRQDPEGEEGASKAERERVRSRPKAGEMRERRMGRKKRERGDQGGGLSQRTKTKETMSRRVVPAPASIIPPDAMGAPAPTPAAAPPSDATVHSGVTGKGGHQGTGEGKRDTEGSETQSARVAAAEVTRDSAPDEEAERDAERETEGEAEREREAAEVTMAEGEGEGETEADRALPPQTPTRTVSTDTKGVVGEADVPGDTLEKRHHTVTQVRRGYHMCVCA
ncbi:hypothetical protein KIPB_011374, partial [Kipferlia bialata]